MTDPIDQQVIGRTLLSIAEEMGLDLLRNAFSSIVREAKDMSTAIFDRDGILIAQADAIPMLLGTMTTAIEGCLRHFPPEHLTADTVLLTNDPYQGGQHLNDIVIFMPVFQGGERVGFVGTIAHHLDMGGATPGFLWSAVDIFEEGVSIPPLRLDLVDGRFPGLFEELWTANVRTPSENLGDLNAQLAALHTGRARLESLAAKYGPAYLQTVMDALLDSSERVMRSVLGSIRDFDVSGEAWLDDDGMGGDRMVARVRVVKEGDRLLVDLSGSSHQRACMMNANLSSTLSSVWSAVRQVFGAGVEMWHNAGAVRPIQVEVPEGSFLNAHWPASIHGRTISVYRVYDAMMEALSRAVPERVSGAGWNSSICMALSRVRKGAFDILAEVQYGGWGGRRGSDGPDAQPFPLSNCANVSVEYVEDRFPFVRIRRYGLVPNSAGAGEYRGGFGELREYEVLDDDVFLTVFTDRFRYPAPGVLGGLPGATGRIEVVRGTDLIRLPSKTQFLLRPGDLLRIVGGGGGGYGPVEQRTRDRIEADIAAELISEVSPLWRADETRKQEVAAR